MAIDPAHAWYIGGPCAQRLTVSSRHKSSTWVIFLQATVLSLSRLQSAPAVDLPPPRVNGLDRRLLPFIAVAHRLLFTATVGPGRESARAQGWGLCGAVRPLAPPVLPARSSRGYTPRVLSRRAAHAGFAGVLVVGGFGSWGVGYMISITSAIYASLPMTPVSQGLVFVRAHVCALWVHPLHLVCVLEPQRGAPSNPGSTLVHRRTRVPLSPTNRWGGQH